MTSGTLVVNGDDHDTDVIFVIAGSDGSTSVVSGPEEPTLPPNSPVTHLVIDGHGGDDAIEAPLGHNSLNAALHLTLDGGAGNDSIIGSSGADTLIGGLGTDVLTGGAGADRFVFKSAADSPVKHPDSILDFHHAEGDRVDLSAIDAQTGVAGNQAFHFIGTAAFTGHAGELHIAVIDRGFVGVDGHEVTQTIVSGDVNGDGVADFAIDLGNAGVLHASDFVL
jgi:Ca2+-binding RTX toxin-like protein